MRRCRRFQLRFAPLGLLFTALGVVLFSFSCTSSDDYSPPSVRLPGLTSTRDAGNGCVAQSVLCSGACTDLRRDPNNCGTCGTVCGTGMRCSSSKCSRASAYAIRKISYGDTDETGAPNKDAWKKFGRDLDRTTSTGQPGGALSCKPVAGPSPDTLHHEDGEGGIDNSFGRNILPLLAPFIPNPSTTATAMLEEGGRTNMLELTGWGDAAAFNDDPGTQFWRSEKLGSAGWQGRDIRDTVPFPNLTTNPTQAYSSRIDGDGSYTSFGTFLTLTLDLVFGNNTTMTIALKAPAVTMRISADKGTASEGKLSGAIAVSELEAAVAALVGRSNKDLCAGPTLDAMKASIRQAADVNIANVAKQPFGGTTDGGTITFDAGAPDPEKECDGISVGIGFEASLVVVGKKRAADPPVSDPCAQ